MTAPVIDALQAQLAPWLPGYPCRILDGNHLPATEHRIDPLRTTWAAPLPGRALVVLHPQRMLIEHAILTEDGHASERSLLERVLELVEKRELWIADRNFCTLKFLGGIHRQGAFFVIRQHAQLKGENPSRWQGSGRCATGQAPRRATPEDGRGPAPAAREESEIAAADAAAGMCGGRC